MRHLLIAIMGSATTALTTFGGSAVPKATARWLAKNVIDGTATGVEKSCPDASGSGPSLTLGNSVVTSADPLRGVSIDNLEAQGSGLMYFSCPSAPSRTISAWVKHPNGPSNGYGVGAADKVYLLRDFCGISITNPYISSRKNYQWEIVTGPEETATDVKFTVERDLWRQVVVTVADRGDGKADLCAYVDGKLVSSATDVTMPTPAATTTYVSGKAYWTKYSVSGQYDDICFWTSALTAEQVKSLYLETRKNTMIGHWPMSRIDEEGGVRTTPDISGSGMPLTLGTGNVLADGVNGQKGVFFDGTANSYADGVNKLGYYVGDWTFTYWIRRDASSGWANLLTTYRQAVGANGWLMMQDESIDVYDGMFGLGYDHFKACGRDEEWVHGAMRVEFFDYDQLTDPGEWKTAGKARITSFINGKKTAECVKENATFEDCTQFDAGTAFVIGNRRGHDSPFRGVLQDVRLYTGALTDEEIRRVYAGPAAVSAGEDFFVATEVAELHGCVSPYPAAKAAQGFAGEQTWALVSGPATAAIANPHGEATRIVLPVEGTYVFRLSSTDLGLTLSDEVSVTRVASSAASAPSLDLAVDSQSGLGAVVSAAASAGARIRWSKVSGPSGVWFAAYDEGVSAVTFGADGTYVLSCSAEKDGATVEKTLELSVSGRSVEGQLNVGLGAYWPMEIWETYTNDTSKTFCQIDPVSGCKFQHNSATPFSSGAGYDVGVGGSYAVHDVVGTGSEYFYCSDYDYRRDDAYLTMSFWMRHSGDSTENVWMASLLSISYALGFHYLPEGGASTDFEIANSDGDSKYRMRFQGPSVNLTNRWTHVVIQFDQLNSGGSEVWVDGMKLPVKSGTTGRARDTSPWAILFASNSTFAPPVSDPSGATMSTRFPGSLDELRLYRRKLTPVEIKYLAAYPAHNAVRRAPSVTIPVDKIAFPRKGSSSLAATAFAQAGESVSCKWTVVSGAADGLAFDDDTLLQPTVTGVKSGDYRLQLAVDDGVRVTYADPVLVTVEKSGSVILLR